MNIKRAKQEIKDAIAAYLLKDEYGAYEIPVIRQRPILLLGAPGIGKTQIMEQIARECGIGLVAYTITHHTRQSAIGLPFISEMEFDGEKKAVTEYTMSEIVASIYVRDAGSGHAAVSAVQDFRKSSNSGGLDHCGGGQSAGIQQICPGF